MQRVGSRRQVWNKTAKQTSGGLTRSELFQDKYGNLKSRKASKKAKKNKNLKKAGWTFKKGSFGAVRIDEKKKKGTKGKKKTKRWWELWSSSSRSRVPLINYLKFFF